jgi:hypothetical protein
LTTLGALAVLARRGGVTPVLPAAALFATQALWFVAPSLARHYAIWQGAEPLGVEHAAYAFLWVAIGHSIQYLWICAWYARQQGRAGSGTTSYLTKCLLAGAAIWTVPAIALAPGMLGRVPYDLGLAALISAVVNLHHFVLDGAIWKLRDGRVARILLRSGAEREPSAPASSTAPLRPTVAVWAVGALCAFLAIAPTFESELVFRRALDGGDFAGADRSIERLAWMGRASPSLHANLAAARALSGDFDGAVRDAERSLALFPTAEGWYARAWVEQLRGETARAIATYQQALALDPSLSGAANNLAWLRATAADPLLRDPRQAVELAESAARATGYLEPESLDTLAAAYASAFRFDAAVRFGEQAVERARVRGDTAEVNAIATRVALYRAGRPYVQPAGAIRLEGLASDSPSYRVEPRLQ